MDIVFDETIGFEGRAGYYDKAGALVDMIQSHLLLVMALAAMEPSSSLDADDLRGSRPGTARHRSNDHVRLAGGRIQTLQHGNRTPPSTSIKVARNRERHPLHRR
ncbi:hypothetical protein [Cryobacterium algoritolerans]|uniref:hypothetical protein n=1 Tax=Cryobacterium algoritolerans TaxID=1259184 RepID=UPI003B97A503